MRIYWHSPVLMVLRSVQVQQTNRQTAAAAACAMIPSSCPSHIATTTTTRTTESSTSSSSRDLLDPVHDNFSHSCTLFGGPLPKNKTCPTPPLPSENQVHNIMYILPLFECDSIFSRTSTATIFHSDRPASSRALSLSLCCCVFFYDTEIPSARPTNPATSPATSPASQPISRELPFIPLSAFTYIKVNNYIA